MFKNMTLAGKVLLFAAVTAICSEGVLTSCDPGWTQFKDKCYIMKTTTASFFDNDKWCQSIGATMVSIHSSDQNEFLRNLAPKRLYTWLGGYHIQKGREDNKWLDGSQWDFSNAAAEYINPYDKPTSCWMLNGYAAGKWAWIQPETRLFQMCQKLGEGVEKEEVKTEDKTGVKPEVKTEDKCRELTAQMKEIQTANDIFRQEVNQRFNKQSIDLFESKRELAESLDALNATAEANRELIKSLNATVLRISESVSQCPKDWQQFREYCYINNETVGTFDQNNGWCQSLNANMLSIHSLYENEFVSRFISGKTWMSGKQTELGSNEFKWLDSLDTSFDNLSSSSDCIPGCGLVLDTNGEWTFAYVHSPRHVNHMVCKKQINEKEKDNELRQKMQLLEKLVFDFLGKSGNNLSIRRENRAK